jgi:hypothetical protein
MAMLGTGVHVQIAKQFRTQARLGKHSLDSLLDHAGWMLYQLFRRSAEALTAGEARVADVLLVAHFVASQDNFCGIDYNDVVSTVYVRSVVGPVLSAKAKGNFRSQATKCLVFGVRWP